MNSRDELRNELAEEYSEEVEQNYIDYGKRPTVYEIYCAGFNKAVSLSDSYMDLQRESFLKLKEQCEHLIKLIEVDKTISKADILNQVRKVGKHPALNASIAREQYRKNVRFK